MMHFLKSKLIIHCSLFIILLIGAFFRFYGLNWDQGYHLHPDERMITMVATAIHFPQTPQEWENLLTPMSSLNPKFFPYGSFPIYLLKFTGFLFSLLNPNWQSYEWINLLGRGLSALADLAVIVLVFLIGKNIWSEKIGLLASLFYSLAVFPIQTAHFYAVDTFLNFFILVTLYSLIKFYEKSSFSNAILVGLFFGLSLATKVSATLLMVTIGTALAVDLFLIFLKRVRQIRLIPKIHREFLEFIVWTFSAFKTPKREKLITILLRISKFGALILLFAFAVFVIFEPYAIIDFQTFWRQTQEQHQMTKSAYTFPYTLQYVGTIPYLYHLKNLILWGMGIPLGSLSILAVFWIIFRLIKEVPKPGNENQEAKILILAVFCLSYFLVVGLFTVKFMRYLLPLYPIFCLFAAYFLQTLIENKKKLISFLGKTTLAFTLAFTFLWSLAFVSIYTKPNSRVSASYWINQNILPGSKLAIEHWDDRLPLFGGENFYFLEMPMYESDHTNWKWQKVDNNLRKADYLILASNRLYFPLQKLSDCQKFKVCYPKTAQYYRDLFSGNLGFTKIAEFSSYPNLEIGNWKLEIVDSSADESFTVYDHPKIIIFKSQL